MVLNTEHFEAWSNLLVTYYWLSMHCIFGTVWGTQHLQSLPLEPRLSGQSYTLCVRSVHCVLNMQMSGTNYLGGNLWHQHFFFFLSIYTHHYLLCPFFTVFLLWLLPIVFALMKAINFLVKWPAYLGWKKKKKFKSPKITEGPFTKDVMGCMVSLLI